MTNIKELIIVLDYPEARLGNWQSMKERKNIVVFHPCITIKLALI